MKMQKQTKKYIIKLDEIPSSNEKGKNFNFTPENEELKSIAKRLKITKINSLNVKGYVAKIPDLPIYRINAKVNANISMICTVSLEEFTSPFEQNFQWDITHSKQYETPDPKYTNQNYPEYIQTNYINIIEYATQIIGLHMPTYPRKINADLQDWKNLETAEMIQKGWLTFNAPTSEKTNSNAFEALNKLKE